jgi:hypothetical protein
MLLNRNTSIPLNCNPLSHSLTVRTVRYRGTGTRRVLQRILSPMRGDRPQVPHPDRRKDSAPRYRTFRTQGQDPRSFQDAARSSAEQGAHSQTIEELRLVSSRAEHETVFFLCVYARTWVFT